MSILIKGMKMPKNCKTCGFVVCDDEYSPEYWCPIVRDGVDNYVHCRHKLCPLVDIPPHGELIDKDKLINRCKQFKDMQFEHGETWEAGIDTCINIIEFHVPTVIESEDE